MADRKSKYAVSARDKISSIGGDTMKNLNENFTTEFLKYADEYNVYPLPRIVKNIDYRMSSISTISEKIEDDESPIFHLTYTNKKLISPIKIESKGREISICILDALNSTMQKYNTITVLKLPNCKINAFGIMQIAEMIMNIKCIKDLNLDMNPNTQENYHLLCTPGGSLKYLSLRLCEITDNGIKKIAKELEYHDPPDNPKLTILNLAHNHITKNGAGHIGNMLRTNRSLSCLVLLGNRICDEGASLIVQELKMITLKHEEIVELRRRKFAELALLDEWMEKKKMEEIDKSINGESVKKNVNNKFKTRQNRKSKKSLQDSSMIIKEEGNLIEDSDFMHKFKTIVEDEMPSHPFRKESYPMHGEIMAIGNLELQYLDLSYNHLTKNVLEELINCLYYQNYMLRGNTSKGLLYVLIEGNNIKKKEEREWHIFEKILQQRQTGESLKNNAFREFVSKDCEILRQNVCINNLS